MQSEHIDGGSWIRHLGRGYKSFAKMRKNDRLLTE